jgi:metal-responsive CopG/Arc/MetJ family transcriptional regulator
MKRVNINFKDKQHEELRKISYEEKSSISDQVRKAVDEYLKKRNGNQENKL